MLNLFKPKTRKTGYKRDKHDVRDLRFSAASTSLPPSIDLSMTGCLAFQFDQKSTSSCVAHAITEGVKLLECRDAEKDLANPSRLFVYYNGRAEDGFEKEDAGCYIRSGLKAAQRHGIADETVWPFKINTLGFGSGNVNKKPSAKAYEDAAKRKTVFVYRRVEQNLDDLRIALSQGFPIVVGLTVTTAWDLPSVSRTGVLPLPHPSDKENGGHALLIIGYDDQKRLFKFKNSWGASWGAKGYGFAPYEYLTDPRLAYDLWALTDC